MYRKAYQNVQLKGDLSKKKKKRYGFKLEIKFQFICKMNFNRLCIVATYRLLKLIGVEKPTECLRV